MKSNFHAQGSGVDRDVANSFTSKGVKHSFTAKRVKHSSGRLKKSLITTVAAALSVGLVASGAMADAGGGGGVPGSGGGTDGYFSTYYMMFDAFNADHTPAQGYGAASVQWFYDNSGEAASPYDHAARDRMDSACATALTLADARRTPDTPAGQSRVVGMYWAGSGSRMWGDGAVNPDIFRDYYEGWKAAGRPGVLSNLPNQAEYDNLIENGFYEAYNAVGGAETSAMCIALNAGEPTWSYDLGVETDTQTFDVAGSTAGIRDTIHATANPASIQENVTANVILNWDGLDGSPKSVTKQVAISNNGDTLSPEFTPADFGWSAWASGDFWFDVQVAEQGLMKPGTSVDTADRDARESWTAAPVPPSKQLTSGDPADALGDNEVLASGMFYNAEISANANGYISSMRIFDTIATDQVFIGSKDADDAAAPYVVDPAGNTVADAVITIDRSTAGQVIVSGEVANLSDAFSTGTYKLVVPTYVLPTQADYQIADDSQVCYAGAGMNDPSECLEGNSEITRKVTPTPDKVWVLDEAGALTEADPSWTNQQGADEKVFLMNDEVAAVVNGRIPANLAEVMINYQIIDDWTKAAEYVDFTDASKANVFIETAPGSGSYENVTAEFDISIDGTVTTATAKEGSQFLAETKGLPADRKVKLVISGQFRDDYDTNGETVVLYNDGAEVWNNETIPTNEPPVYTWTPNPNKQVLGSADESGDDAHSDINGQSVWPGQKLEYSIGIDLRVPGNTAHGVKTLAVEDVYDPYFIPEKSSIEFWDSRDPLNPKPVPRKAYDIVFDQASHTFTATFTDEWIAANVTIDGVNSEWNTQGWLTMRFTGTVSPDIAEGSTVVNQAFQIINGAKTATEVPVVEVPVVNPDKEDLNTDLIDIDGKTVVEGDIILYRLTLDANPARDQLAYNVHKLGMVDDFDEEYLDVDPTAIKVTDKVIGEDVTAKFNVQVKDGVAYIFAKTVDTEGVYEDLIPGDPQPEDLAAYDQASIRPLEDPIIDQGLLGKQYWITMPSKVIKETDGYVIENQAVQNIQNTHKATKIVSNPLKDIDPDKDVVVSEETKDNSINESEIALHSIFNYRLNSSEIPANRAYEASQWSLSDTFDRVHDSYTGIWAIYANTDVYDGEELLFAKGDLLQDSVGHEGETLGALFDVTFNEESYTITVTATQAYLDLVNSRGDLAQSFSVYTKMERIAPSERVENQVTESYNEVTRESNVVWTSTPENPEISIVKFTLDEGAEDGDRDTTGDAFPITAAQFASMGAADAATNPEAGVKVGFIITNTGDVDLKNVTVSDATLEGTKGSIHDLDCEIPLTDDEKSALGEGAPETKLVPGAEVSTYLKVGESFDCVGTLLGLAAGEVHGDNAIATGESVYTDTKVTAEDPWFAQAPSAPVNPQDPDKGAITGEVIASGVNPWFLGGGVGLLAIAIAVGAALYGRRDRAGAAVLAESNGSDSVE